MHVSGGIPKGTLWTTISYIKSFPVGKLLENILVFFGILKSQKENVKL
jgi:hypothetical protein